MTADAIEVGDFPFIASYTSEHDCTQQELAEAVFFLSCPEIIDLCPQRWSRDIEKAKRESESDH